MAACYRHWLPGVPRWYDDRFAGDIAVVTDLTDQKRVEEKLAYHGTHDALTGLYNYAHFESELSRLESSRQYPVSVVIADVDNMKPVNDSQGHAAGDELLRCAATVLASGFRTGDTVARIGGGMNSRCSCRTRMLRPQSRCSSGSASRWPSSAWRIRICR